MNYPSGRLPVIALRNTVIFPGLSQVIKVGRKRSVNALHAAQKNSFWVITVQQKSDSLDSPEKTSFEPADLHRIGTLCRIDSMRGQSESGFQVVLRGFVRVELDELALEAPASSLNATSAGKSADSAYITSEVRLREDIDDLNLPTRDALLKGMKELAQEILDLVPGNTEALGNLVKEVTDLSYMTSLCAGNLDITLEEKQKLLEVIHLRDRSLQLLNLMKEFKEGLEVQNEIRGKLNQKLGRAQRETILREHLKTIKSELGESSAESPESLQTKLEEKIEASGMPEDVRKIARQELQRLSDIGPQSPETHVIRNYLELLTSLPWSTKSAEQEIDLEQSKKILDEDHWGMETVKKRILEQLAIYKLKKSAKGTILLLQGPPGVGKTSLGESIAKAMGRKFVRVSLGGVRDDAEIRGHRRTYVGSMPGRIIQGIKRVSEKNPVFLLDEIDKLSRAFSGDPAAALLEVLDPAQNATFTDHYLDVPFDLSEVIFIATANQLDTIPGPLLDRMEIIDMSGYTSAEKLQIAKRHLWPTALEQLGLSSAQVEISDLCISELIQSYTREAGVRELSRQLTRLLRSISQAVAGGTSPLPIRLEQKDLTNLLGPEKFHSEVTDSNSVPGMAVGLSWSPVGGNILFIESTSMPGKGGLILTGQLGDVMKESATISQSLLRSSGAKWGIHQDLSLLDLHVHVPAGAIPKDGPSAGVTLVTSLVSMLTGKPVSPKVAMTGEVTLRGNVLPVGGIKEKVLAAHRAGVESVILPLKNKKDLSEVPLETRESLQFHFVENIDQVLALSL